MSLLFSTAREASYAAAARTLRDRDRLTEETGRRPPAAQVVWLAVELAPNRHKLVPPKAGEYDA